MKRIITIIAITACAAALLNSCQKTTPEIKKGIPLTIQATKDEPAGTKTIYEYDTEDKTLKGSWDSEESITVVSFGRDGITAIDIFTSTGEAGREKAEFSGTWTGNEGDKIICLYPSVDTYAGNSIFDGVRLYSPTIYMRNLSTASGALQHDDPSSVSDVDLMLGEVTISGDVAHVNMEHQFAVFRIEVTLRNFPYEAPPGSPFDQARINSIRIKCVDPDSDEEEEWGVNGDPVFVRMSGLDVTTGSYTGEPFTIERGPLDYYLLDSGNNSDLTLMDEDGEYSDWLELYNGSGAPIDLTGYTLSDDEENRRKWTLPAVTLGAGEYRLVFASGKDRASPAGELHANFRLSASGESVWLYDPLGEAVSWVEFGECEPDASLSRDAGGEMSFAMEPTPGYENTRAGARSAMSLLRENEPGLYINGSWPRAAGMTGSSCAMPARRRLTWGAWGCPTR